MNNTNNALETLVQRDKQIKKANDKLKASINELDAELETTTNALSNHASNTNIHTSKEELIQLIVDHLESLDLGITKEVVSVLPTENISDNTLYFVPNSKGSSDEYFYINDKWELIGSTETNLSDYYTKQETNTLLEDKANSVHNHVVSDIIDMPTIPTKTSELINDSGFLTSSSGVITSVSWSDIKDKPNFSTVATSGSYNDLSNKPTIPTKVSQLENDTGFINGLSDVVDTKSNQTINGTKTFTASPFVSNYAVTNGYFTKLNTVGRNEVPSQIYHSAFRVFDKNAKTLGEYCVEKSTSGSSLLHMDVHTEDSEGNDIMESLYLNLSNDGSTVSFHPAKNNRTDLGMPHYKWSKIYSDDVVHTSGDESISGNKFFTQDVNVKNSDVDIAVTPSNNLFSCFRFRGKGNVTTASIQYSQRTYGVNDICFYVFDADSNSHGFRIRTDNRLEPIENNTYSLGSSSAQWADAYINKIICTRFTHSVNNGSVYITGGSEYDKGATLVLHGEESSDAGSFIINSRDKTRSLYLVGKPDGTLQWAGQNIALDGNLVHRTGNETIQGVKYFDNVVYLHNNMSNKNSQMDLLTTPANTLYAHYMFVDKNNQVTAYIQYGQQNTGTDFIGLFIHDKTKALHGIQVTTNNEVIPISNNTYSLGSAARVWNTAYINRITCANIIRPVENSYIYMTAGPSYNSGASIFLNGKTGDGLGTGKGTFLLFARDGTSEKRLLGYPNGLLSWNGCIESHEVRSITANAFMAQNGGYTCTLRNDGSNTYLLMSEKDGTPGTWSTARPLTISNATGTCNINGNANSATYATTQATTDNSTKIATTAWVRTYVNSVAGTNTVGSSVSAYWSNSSNVTATGQSSGGGYYPECYSDYITKTPTVGTIYSGAQLYTVLNTYASAKASTTGSSSSPIYVTNTTAQATFSSPINPSGKYLCTTANTVKFRAYTASGSASAVGTSSVVNNSSTKSIFIRVE